MEQNTFYQSLCSQIDQLNIWHLVYLIIVVLVLIITFYLFYQLQKEVDIIKQKQVQIEQQNKNQQRTVSPSKTQYPQIKNEIENVTPQQQSKIQITMAQIKNQIETHFLQKIEEFEKKNNDLGEQFDQKIQILQNEIDKLWILKDQQDQNIQNLQNQIDKLQNLIEQPSTGKEAEKNQDFQNQIDKLQNLIEQQSLNQKNFEKTISDQNIIIEQQSQKLQLQLLAIEDFKQQITTISNKQINYEEQFLLQNKKIEDKNNEVTSINNELSQISDQIKNSQKQNDQKFEELKLAIKQINTEIQHNENQKEKTIVQDLYELTIKKRHVEAQFKPFVNDELRQEDVLSEYGMGNKNCKNTLKQDLRGMRRVRGDGNCFYTSFVFQYLQKILIEENDQEFDNFIKTTQSLKFQIRYKEREFQEIELKQVQKQFIKQCQVIRKIDDQNKRLQTLCQLFKDDECEFYGQSIIFLRSLVFKICDNLEQRELFKAQGLNLEQQILEWEQDCESNEPIINELSKYLQIQTILYFVDSKNKSILVNKFNEQTENQKNTFYLIFRPGHYSIGLPKTK